MRRGEPTVVPVGAPVGVPAGMEERRRWPSTPADPRTQHGGRRRVGGGESGGDRRAARRQRRCRRTCRRGRSTADGGGADDDDGADDGGGRGRADGWATAQIPPRGGGYRGVAVGAGGRMGARPPRSPPVGGGAEGWRVVRAGRRVGDRPDPPPWGRGAEGCRSATVAPKRAGLQSTVLICRRPRNPTDPDLCSSATIWLGPWPGPACPGRAGGPAGRSSHRR